jgi:hypothetical protein
MAGDVAGTRWFHLDEGGGQGTVDGSAVSCGELRVDDLSGQLVPEPNELTVAHP